MYVCTFCLKGSAHVWRSVHHVLIPEIFLNITLKLDMVAPIIPEIGRRRQEDKEFKVLPGYIVGLEKPSRGAREVVQQLKPIAALPEV